MLSLLTKVFWKGEFEGKNLFFKKGFPLIIKLEKTFPKKGASLLATESFFKAGDKIPASFKSYIKRILRVQW